MQYDAHVWARHYWLIEHYRLQQWHLETPWDYFKRSTVT